MTDTPTVIAIAAISAATVTALRCSERPRFCAARRAIATGAATRAESRAPESVRIGATNANPITTKSALTNPSSAGPVVTARPDATPATTSAARPTSNQRGGETMLPSITVPRFSARIGSIRAPSHAGNQAAISTEPSPNTTAAPSNSGVRWN